MSSDGQLQDMAQKFTADLVKLYGGASACVAFLPGGVPVPDDLVQNGLVNPTQVDSWLHTAFDSPLLVRPADATVGARSSSSASDIYALAVSAAQPAGVVDSPAWQRAAAEITTAQAQYGPPGGDKPIVCFPDDWPLPGNQSYWATFDSSVTTTTTTTTTVGEGPPPPRVDPLLWRLRTQDLQVEVPPHPVPVFTRTSIPVEPRPMLRQTAVAAAGGDSGDGTDGGDRAIRVVEHAPSVTRRVPITAERMLAAPAALAAPGPAAPGPAAAGPAAPAASAAVAAGAPAAMSPVRTFQMRDLRTLPANIDYTVVLSQAPAVDTVTTTDSSSLTVHLEHTCVSLRRALGDQNWWNGVFLTDPSWYVPGMPSGTLLGAPPPPAAAADGTAPDEQVFAIPVGLIVVRNLSVSGQWSAQAAQALSSSSASLGPLTLAGASSASSAGDTLTYSRPGMQVVAVLCATLPVLPPIDPPADPPAPTPPAPAGPTS